MYLATDVFEKEIVLRDGKTIQLKDGEKAYKKGSSQYVIVRPNGSRRVVSDHSGVLVTKQAFADECDINAIMNKFRKTGIIDHLAMPGLYGDFSGDNSFETLLERQKVAAKAFDDLPVDLKARFRSPAELLQFVSKNGVDALESYLPEELRRKPKVVNEAVKTTSKAEVVVDDKPQAP